MSAKHSLYLETGYSAEEIGSIVYTLESRKARAAQKMMAISVSWMSVAKSSIHERCSGDSGRL